MDAQIQISAPARSPRNQLDVAHHKQQFRLQSMAARVEAENEVQQLTQRSFQVASAPIRLDEQARNTTASQSLENQLMMSQIWMAPAIYGTQLALIKQDLPFNPKQTLRIENALASYKAISSVGDTEPGAGLATTA
ncbi:hypothetical protein R6242_01280 [Iodobacter sp. CM08]|uniref:hypothetical protein n=1 Tax=Iodobacter sp. CM08 TaxID=3085902 RepID=UPI0029827382|nr:hypothetical protein [Iodobacter sp. CM08]MDW5415202.1 hypothetical protein [Iodobacter sp. CM08]